MEWKQEGKAKGMKSCWDIQKASSNMEDLNSNIYYVNRMAAPNKRWRLSDYLKNSYT